MGETDACSLIDFLVCRKFGRVARKPRGVKDRIIRHADERLREEAEKYQAELRAMRPEDLQALYDEERAKQRMELQAKADREEAHMFFNQPEAVADFEHWSKVAYWILDEAVALSFGKTPEVVSWEKVKGYVGRSPFANQYSKRRELALRAAHRQQLCDPVLPGFFLAWAKRNDIDYPTELENQVVARGHQIADWKSLYDELAAQHDAHAAEMQALLDNRKKELDDLAAERDSLRGHIEELEQAAEQGQADEKPLRTRERDTLLKLIIGMAVKGYAYDPKAKRSGTASNIVTDLNLLGLSLDDETVRKWLREAAELLPSEGSE